ncbi:MAG: DUF3048 domain-containing protein [Acidimicrobiales bacterium]|jgi:hypothetical protein
MNQRSPQHRRTASRAGRKRPSGFRAWLNGLGRGQRIGIVVAALVVVVGVIAGIALSGGGSKAAVHPSTSTTTQTTRPQSKTNSKLCPLTGLPAPGGKVPRRPALAVKIGNDPASRPQSGLGQADIVYEEMAEGGITRYMVVFQCQNSALVGPTRSVRWDDWNILQQYGHAILAYSGGIQPWMDMAASLPWIYDANGSIYPTANAFYRYNNDALPESQGAPYNYFTSTSALWGLFPNAKTPPPQLFRFSKNIPAGSSKDVSVAIPFSGASDVVWQWSQAAGQWLRFYGTQADLDSTGVQFHTTNVVIQMVQTARGPYDESGPDSPDVESMTVGSGVVYVLRGGYMEKGTWSRPTGSDVTTFTFPNGKPITLQPGQTWYEIVPDYITVAFTR